MVWKVRAAGSGERLAQARELDRADPLASLRPEFRPPASGAIYLNGNSLGQLPTRTLARLGRVADQEWGGQLVRAWPDWIDLPVKVGDRLAADLLGARPGEVAVADSTSVNLYKCVAAVLAREPSRRVLITDDQNFPSDRYVLQGLAGSLGADLWVLAADPITGLDLDLLVSALDERVAAICLSQVAYRSAAVIDMAAVNQAAHRVGALTVWDLCHSVGALPIQLHETGADLAVGCSYKYLHAGPGAPAFLYVRRELQGELQQPIWGWFGCARQFAMEPDFTPAAGIRSFLTGTPPVLGVVAVQEGAALVAEAGIARVRAKSLALTSYAQQLIGQQLVRLGFALASPSAADERGAHLALRHAQAYPLCRMLRERELVVTDFREPDVIRLGLAPLSTSFEDVCAAIDRIAQVAGDSNHPDAPSLRSRVT